MPSSPTNPRNAIRGRPTRRSYRPAIALAAAILLGGLAQPCAASTWRCGSRLVALGDSVAKVLSRCGEPSARTESLEAVTVRWTPTREVTRIVSVETWTYDPGPRQFVRALTFRDGTLTCIDELSYGE